MQKRLRAVTDGAGQLISIADSAGEIDASYAGSGYRQTSWRGAGVMTRGQSFAPRHWETDAQWGEVQQFRNRAYDPGSGRWLQEDPMGVVGGINLYEYNGNDPTTWRHPFGFDPCKNSFCEDAVAVRLATESFECIALGDHP